MDKNVEMEFSKNFKEMIADFGQDVNKIYSDSLFKIRQQEKNHKLINQYDDNGFKEYTELLLNRYLQRDLFFLSKSLEEFKSYFKKDLEDKYFKPIINNAIEQISIDNNPNQYIFNRFKSMYDNKIYGLELDSFIKDFGDKSLNKAFNEAIDILNDICRDMTKDVASNYLSNVILYRNINEQPYIYSKTAHDYKEYIHIDDYNDFKRFTNKLSMICNDYCNKAGVLYAFSNNTHFFNINFSKYDRENFEVINNPNNKDMNISLKGSILIYDGKFTSCETSFYINLIIDTENVFIDDKHVRLYKVSSANYLFKNTALQNLKRESFIINYALESMSTIFLKYYSIMKTKREEINDLLFA